MSHQPGNSFYNMIDIDSLEGTLPANKPKMEDDDLSPGVKASYKEVAIDTLFHMIQ